MICPGGNMNRRRDHKGENGRYGLARGELRLTSITVRDVEDCFVRAVCITSNVKHLVEEASRGPEAELHANHMRLIDEPDVTEIMYALRDELEKLMGMYPNVESAEEVAQRRRSTDVADTGPLGHEFNLANPLSAPKEPRQELPDEQQYDDVYNGWSEREKLLFKMRQLGIAEPKPPLYKRFWWWMTMQEPQPYDYDIMLPTPKPKPTQTQVIMRSHGEQKPVDTVLPAWDLKSDEPVDPVIQRGRRHAHTAQEEHAARSVLNAQQVQMTDNMRVPIVTDGAITGRTSAAEPSLPARPSMDSDSGGNSDSGGSSDGGGGGGD